MPTTGIITIKEAADMLRISEWKMYQLCKNNEIRYFRVGRSIRIDASDINKYIEIRKRHQL